jgi:hypothetical protein
LNCTTITNPSNSAFDFVIGGGFDVPVKHWLSIRPMQVDYVLTRFGNGFTKGNQKDQVKQLVLEHPNLNQEQRDKILSKLQVVTLAQNRRVDITLSITGQQSVRQFPFNAEDALTLLSPKEGGAKPEKKKPSGQVDWGGHAQKTSVC